MNLRCSCIFGDVGVALLASAAITSWAAGGNCNNDAGSGDVDEGGGAARFDRRGTPTFPPECASPERGFRL